jgi:hypothetical protein
MPIPTPSERPDLYDDYDGQVYSPTSLDYILSVTSDHLQRLIETRQGRSFIDIAKEQVADSWRRALMYYEVDAEVFRRIQGRPLELFDQKTGKFDAYHGDASVMKLGMPMDIEDIRRFMRADPHTGEPK